MITFWKKNFKYLARFRDYKSTLTEILAEPSKSHEFIVQMKYAQESEILPICIKVNNSMVQLLIKFLMLLVIKICNTNN